MTAEDRNWVVVADAAAAVFYVRHGRHGELEQVRELINESGRAKVADLLSDSAGRSFDSHGQGRHAMASPVDPKDTGMVRFAEDVVESMVTEIRAGHVRRYALVAAPVFLGHLRRALSKHRVPEPEQSVAKDLVGHDRADIAAALDARRDRGTT